MEAASVLSLLSAIISVLLGSVRSVPLNCNPTCSVEIDIPGGHKELRSLGIGAVVIKENTISGCIIAKCKETGLALEQVQCTERPCTDGTAPILLPGNCCPTCVGEGEPQSCSFTQWSSWGRCSTSCGAGHQARVRRVEGIAHVGFISCHGQLTQVRPCSESNSCPVHCVWRKERCPTRCGRGEEIKEYYIITQPPRHGGQPCPPHVEYSARRTTQCC